MIRYVCAILILLCSCEESKEPVEPGKEPPQKEKDTVIVVQDTVLAKDTIQPEIVEPPVITELELNLIDKGLVNVQSLDSNILVDLKYTTTDNFIGKDVYGDFDKAYLQPDVAEKLVKAQNFLKEKDSSLTLLIYDAVRPRSVQQKMWDVLDMPIEKKVKFVSNPINGSIHNYGAAIDLTIATQSGEPLDMGAGFDDPSPEAWPVKEKQMLAEGRITEQHIKNRQLLRSVMGKAGFFNIQSEWWHFNSCYRVRAKELYEIVE